MSWVTDPHQLAELPTVEEIEFEVDEPPTPDEIFHESFRHYSDSVGYELGIHTDVCRIGDGGEHITMAKNCPHFDMEDEEGRRIAPGWTVQSGR